MTARQPRSPLHGWVLALLLGWALGLFDGLVGLIGAIDSQGWGGAGPMEGHELSFLGMATALNLVPVVLGGLLAVPAWLLVQRRVKEAVHWSWWALAPLGGWLACHGLLLVDQRVRNVLAAQDTALLLNIARVLVWLGGQALWWAGVTAAARLARARDLSFSPGWVTSSGAAVCALTLMSLSIWSVEEEAHPWAEALHAESEIESPDVVLLLLDTLRADAVGWAARPLRPGAASVTPELDAWAESALRFTDAYAQSSWTRPSVASITAGELCAGHSVYQRSSALPGGAETLAEVLQRDGYRTASIITNPQAGVQAGFGQGYDQVVALQPPLYTRTLPMRALFLFGGPADAFYRGAGDVVDTALAFLNDTPAGGRFLYLHFMDPHAPYLDGRRGFAPNPFGVSQFDASTAPAQLQSYLDDVAYMDRELGRLFDALGPDTLVALVSDHGEEFAEHGGWRHGHSLHAEVVRVPMAVGGGALPAGLRGQTYAEPVEALDLPATLVGLVDAERPERWRGASLVDRSEEGDWFTTWPDPERPAVSELSRWGHRSSALRLGDWRLIMGEEDGTPYGRLYRVSRDPGELEDQAEREPETVERLAARLAREVSQAGEGALDPEQVEAESRALEAQLHALGYTGDGESQAAPDQE